ncbi:MAG: hypothetical protein WBH24_02130 [Candidatus Acidiferrum sp.]
MLGRDLQIGQATRDLGRIGMIAAMAWLAYRVYHDATENHHPTD